MMIIHNILSSSILLLMLLLYLHFIRFGFTLFFEKDSLFSIEVPASPDYY